MRLAGSAGAWRARAGCTFRVAFDAFVAHLDAQVGNALTDATIVEEELVEGSGVARGARRGQAFTGEARSRARFAPIQTLILDEAIWALCQASLFMKEQELVDSARRASLGRAEAREARWVTKFAPLCVVIEIAANGALLDTGVHLQEGPAVGDVRILRVTTQALGWLGRGAVFARVVALGIDGETGVDLVNEVVEGVVDQVVRCHLE